VVGQIARIEDLPGILKRLNALPKTAQAEIRTAAQAIADEEAERIRAAASGSGGQAAAIAPFIKARRDRVPAIAAGGSAKAKVAGGATRGEIFFGAEFGGQARPTTQQFRPHKGREGYFFYPTLRADSERMVERWLGVVRAVEREWGKS
jgi:hypothetical protein